MSMKNGFDEVFDFSFWFMSIFLILEMERRGYIGRNTHLERHLIHSWLKALVRNLENALLETKEVSTILMLLVSFHLSISYVVVLPIIADEGHFLTTFNFNFDMFDFASLEDFEVNLSIDNVSGLIERELGLNLDVTLVEFTACVVKIVLLNHGLKVSNKYYKNN